MKGIQRWMRRNAFPLLTGVGLTGMFIYFAFLPRRVGLNLWPDFVSGLSQATVLVGPIAAGACAVVASRVASPLASRLQVSARTPSVAVARQAVTTIAPIAVSFPLALLILGIYGAATGTYGTPSGPWLLAIASTVVVACSSGYFVGLLIGSRWFTAPVVAVGYFALYVILQSVPLPHGYRSLFPAIPNRDTEFAHYITQTTWAQVVLFLGIACLFALLARPRGVRVERALLIAAIPVAIASVVAGAVVVSTNGQYLTGYNSRDFVCDGSDPVICVNKGYAGALDGLTARFEVFETKTIGTSLQPQRLEQNVEGVGDEPSTGSRSIYIEGIDAAGLDQTVARYVTKYGGSYACSDDTPYPTFVATIIVDVWLSGVDQYGLDSLDSTAEGASEWNRFRLLTPTEGNEWLREHEQAYLTCNLTLADLP